MDKRGIEFGIGTVVAFLILIIVAIVIIVGFRAYVSEMFGWIGEQLANIKKVAIFGVEEGGTPLARIRACKERGMVEEFTEQELNQIKKYYKKDYMEWLSCVGDIAYQNGDYEDAKAWYQKYLESCENKDLKDACVSEEKARISNNINKINLRIQVDKDWEEIRSLGREASIQAYKEFIKKYKDEPDSLVKAQVGDAEAIVMEAERETIGIETKEDLIKHLKNSEDLRVTVRALTSAREEALKVYKSEIADNQMKAEAIFSLIVNDIENENCEEAFDLLMSGLEAKYKDIVDFKYLRYSYPIGTEGIYKISRFSILNEAKLVLAWCYTEKGEYRTAYNLLNTLLSFIPGSLGGSFLQVYKRVVFELADSVDCSMMDTQLGCHKYHPLTIDGKEVASQLEITTFDINKYPKLGCWWGGRGIFHSLNIPKCNTCSVFEGRCEYYRPNRLSAGLGYGTWIRTCEEDPCGARFNYEDPLIGRCQHIEEEGLWKVDTCVFGEL